jgi:hypothetical protein
MTAVTQLQSAKTLFIPKGRNRAAATNWLIASGVQLPDLPGRRLHRRGQ